jgi:DNA-binding HxlR family transcriptional regulator
MPISRKRWPDCPIERTLAVLSGRWKTMIVWRLWDGPKRYGELRDAIGEVAERALTGALSELEEDGIVQREDGAWTLTAAGHRLRPILEAMFAWGEATPERPLAASSSHGNGKISPWMGMRV